MTMAVCFGLLPNPVQASWEKPSQPPAIETPADFFTDSQNRILLAAGQTLFELENGSWKKLGFLPQSGMSIRRIYRSSNGGSIFALTSRDIWKISMENAPPVKIYSGRAEEAPLSFAAFSDRIYYTGTSKGLYESHDAGKTWVRSRSARADEPVIFIYPVKAGVFIGQSEAVWFASTGTVRKVFSFFSGSSESDEESEDGMDSDTEDVSGKSHLLADFSENDAGYFLATARGVFFSVDGLEWQTLPSAGLPRENFIRIAASPGNESVLLAAEKSVYQYDSTSKTWKLLSDGLVRAQAAAVGWIQDGAVHLPALAASDGFLIWKNAAAASQVQDQRAQLFNRLVNLEPSAREIQKRVVHYANVGNGKIKRWHAESRLAAILPDISLGKDLYRANNLDLDRGGTADPDQFIEGPADRHRSFSADISWDLGDMIFSSSQTSIDSRDKLTVELRNDLLAEAMRLYFERRRLQIEIIQSESEDESMRTEKILRLEELTALIDALTNGYLSAQLDKIYRKNPELEELWRFDSPLASRI